MIKLQDHSNEALKAYHQYWDCYSNGDLEGFAAMLDEDFELIGTSETEVAHNMSEGIAFYKAQMQETVGKVENRNRIISAKPFNDLVLINEACDIFVLVENEWNFYSKIRISTLLRETKSGWKVIQQHGSFPDMRVQEGETLAIKKITQENLELRDAVKRRTAELEIKNRELEIEAALEKVRSRSLAMHKSEEMQSVVEEVFARLNELGVGLDTANILIFKKDAEFIESWTASNNIADFRTRFLIPVSLVPHFAEIKNAQDKGQNLVSRSYGLEEKNTWFSFLFTQTDYKYIPEERKEFIINSPLSTFSVGLSGSIGIQLTSYSRETFTHEENNILIRFTKVFEQSYTRFLDLEKAEAQAREAQIEAALERVRSRAMAMQKSDELLQVIHTLSEQLRQLGLHAEAVSFLTDGDERGYNMWLSSPDEDFLSKIFVPRIQDRTTLLFQEAKETGKKYYSYVLSKEEKDIYFQNFFDNTVLRDYPDSGKEQVFMAPGLSTTNVLLDGIILSVSNFDTLPYSDAENEIINRIAFVFQQSYTRFLDLKKAEAQAREAQVEAALERVRAQTMAMHTSEDVGKCVVKMFAELTALGVDEDTRFGIGILNHENENNQLWTARKDGDEVKMHIGNLDMTAHPLLKSARKAWKEQVPIHKYVLEGEDLVNYYQMLNNAPDYKIQIPIKKLREKEIQHCFIFEHGFFYAFTPHEFNSDLIQITKRFSSLFEQTYRRYLDLVKAEELAREAEIELGLERVRARAMAMQNSGELSDLVATLLHELTKLDFALTFCIINIYNEPDLSNMVWAANPEEGNAPESYYMKFEDYPFHHAMMREWKAQTPKYVYVMEGDEKRIYDEYLYNDTEFRRFPEEIKNANRALERYVASFVFSQFGGLQTVGHEELSEGSLDILYRFGKVFDQTYTRFQDLQKAEAQAREAKIESALEKVRSRTMAMQKSDELSQVAFMMFEEFKNLHPASVSLLSRAFVITVDESLEMFTLFLTTTEGLYLPLSYPLPFNEPTNGMPLFHCWKNDEPVLINELTGDVYRQWLQYLDRIKLFIPPNIRAMEKRVNNYLRFSKGFLGITSLEPLAADELTVLKRFAKVFDQTYTRFLDLQRAEAQTREAQIEAALEKVRSRSLAMQGPGELMNVAQLLREEMGALGVEELETSSIYIHDKDSGQTKCWFTIRNSEDASKTVSDQMMIQLNDTWVGQQMKKFYHSQQESTSIVMQGEQRIEWIRYCEGKSALLGTSNFYGDTIPDRTYHLYKFSNGFLGAAAPGEISNESWDLLRRATSVFAFAYTRFLDLQKAEASARAAIRQASLDRVRADISSMRHASDLDRITPLVFNELTTLGIPFIRCGVFIVHEKDGYVDVHLSTPEGKSLAAMKLPANANELTRVSVEAWRNQEVYTQHWNKDEFVSWVKSLQEHGFIQNQQTYQGKDAPPESLDLHFVPFAQGLLYVGSEKPLVHDQIDLVKALAKSFAIAYARYEDFVQLEKAKADIENAMTELKATQSQLVQQEKLASLGQLTAGIAHEIKNPLNFINNFSDVSVELVDEVYEALLQSVNTKNKDDILAILSDVKSNLNIIKQHGFRADGIVRSMLMHSRTSSGRKEPTDLNALITENVNLAYHGMRAGKDAIQVETLLQLDDSVGEVPLIIEDFSRVILNLCSNAFDAMKEKRKKYAALELQHENAKVIGHYFPKIVVRTKRVGASVCIEVEDNGMGIPDDIKDKILQPFFTTKKGTQGTGLGLSITHDIVNAHGGKLEIETEINEYTRFIIILN